MVLFVRIASSWWLWLVSTANSQWVYLENYFLIISVTLHYPIYGYSLNVYLNKASKTLLNILRTSSLNINIKWFTNVCSRTALNTTYSNQEIFMYIYRPPTYVWHLSQIKVNQIKTLHMLGNVISFFSKRMKFCHFNILVTIIIIIKNH